MEYYKIEDFNIRQLNSEYIFSFFEYINKEKQLSNKSYNNYKNLLSTAITFIMKKSPSMFKQNPVDLVDALPVLVKKHAAFTDEQIKKIRATCTDKQLLLFIQFIYYTLARPNEIMKLRISDIDMVENRIFYRAEQSKNKIDEYVPMNPTLKKAIEESGIMDYNPSFSVFSNKGVPSEHVFNSSTYFWKRNVAVLKALEYDKLNSNYSIYSYKHSGAISLYKATKDIKLLQRICRHQSVDQTNHYLRDLGLQSDDGEALKQWVGALD